MKKRFKKILIFIVILGLIIAGIAVFFILNSTPDRMSEAEKEKAVAEILGRKPNLNPDIKTGDSAYDGEKIFFIYPAKAVVYEFVDPGKGNNESIIETFSIDIDNPRLILNYSAVNKLSLQKVGDEPSVKLREDASRGYDKEDLVIDGVSSVVFTKTGGGSTKAEKSVFILTDGVFHTFSITGASLEDVEELFEKVIGSAYFK